MCVLHNTKGGEVGGGKNTRTGRERETASKSEDRQSEIREEDAVEAYEEMEVVETRNANVRF